MSNLLRLFGIAVCLIGIAAFIYSLLSGDRSWFAPGGALAAAGFVILVAAARRSRSG